MASIVFLPGAGGRASFWAPVAERLADLGPHLRLAYPGFGEAPADATIGSLAHLQRWVLARLPAGPVHVVAQSMGGVLALRLALEVPGRVASLVLTATSGGIDMGTHGAADWRAGFRAERAEVPDWFERDRTDLTDRLGEVRAPTLLVCSDADPICPPAAMTFLAEHIPGARTALVRGGTHLFALERPDEVAPLVRAHVTSGESSGGGRT